MCLLLHGVAATSGAPAANDGPGFMVLTSLTPNSGGDFGGNRVVLRGVNLPVFAREGAVHVASNLVCGDLRVEAAGTALSCVMPRCAHCAAVPVQVASANDGGGVSNVLLYAYASECYSGAIPKLPPRFSAAENCTVCRQLVALGVAAVGDVTSHRGIREALRSVCGSRSMREWGPVSAPRCRTDLSTACAILFHAAGDDLADAMWNGWDAAGSGRLPDAACAAVGRCAALQGGGV